MTQGGADAGFNFVVYLTLIALGGGNDAVDPDAPLCGQAVFQLQVDAGVAHREDRLFPDVSDVDADGAGAVRRGAGVEGVFQKVRENGDKVHVGHVGLRGRIRLRGERHARRLRLFGVGAQQLVDHGVRAPRGEVLGDRLLLLKIAQDAVGVARARHSGDAGVVVPLVVADAAALPLCPADSLHVARQVLQLLLDERFSGVSAHIKNVADAQNADRRVGAYRSAESEQGIRLHSVVQPYP